MWKLRYKSGLVNYILSGRPSARYHFSSTLAWTKHNLSIWFIRSQFWRWSFLLLFIGYSLSFHTTTSSCPLILLISSWINFWIVLWRVDGIAAISHLSFWVLIVQISHAFSLAVSLITCGCLEPLMMDCIKVFIK